MLATIGSIARRLRHGRRGVTAVEFALVMPFFLAFLMGIIETGLVFYSNTVVEGAVADAARQIRTGQAQQSADALTTFRDRLCQSLFSIMDCSALAFDVRTFPDFSSVVLTIELDEDGNPLNPPAFTPGGAGDIVVVRVTYRYTFLTPLIGVPFSDNGTNSRLIISTAVFRTEPFDS